MSRSMTVKPSRGGTISRGRGSRGRGTNITQPGRTRPNVTSNMDPMQNEEFPSQNPNQPNLGSNPQDRLERRDAYTVIAPNERKRQQIAKQAQQGEAAYQKHKEKKQLGHVSYVGTVGGGEMNIGVSRTAMQKEQYQNKSPQERARLARERAKQAEDEIHNKHKTQQRLKSENNTMRNSARQRLHDTERRQQNAAFLDRLERESKQHKPARASQHRNPVSTDTSQRRHSDNEPYSEEGASASASGGSSQYSSGLQILSAEYPFCDKEYLQGLLQQVNGDLEAVRFLMS